MKLNNKNKEDILYVIAFAIILIASSLQMTAIYTRCDNPVIGTVTNLVQAFGYFLCIVKIVLSRRKYDIKKIVFSIMMLMLFFVSGMNIQHKFFFLTAILFVATFGVDSVIISKVALCIQGVMLFVVVILSQVGVLEDKIFISGARIRHILGFNWVTVAPIIFFFSCLLYFYVRSDKMKWYEAIPLEIINIYFYQMTDTRMTFLLCSIVIVFFAIQSIWNGWFDLLRKLKWLYPVVPVILVIIAILAAYLYNPENALWLKLNAIMSSRLQLSHDAIMYYGMPLLGQKIVWNGFGLLNDGQVTNYNYVDCSYLQIGMWYGVLVLVVVIFIFIYGIYKAIKVNNYWAVFIMLFAMLHSMTEPHLINVAVDVVILLTFSDIKSF